MSAKNVAMSHVQTGLRMLSRLCMFVVLVVTTAQATEKENPTTAARQVEAKKTPSTLPLQINYEKKTDHLSVAAQSVSLKLLLGKIGRQTGIEVLFDDAAEESLAVNVKSNTLEQGLKNILKGRNYVMRYDKDSKNNIQLVGVMVLPVGSDDTEKAKRLGNIESEAYDHAKSQLTLEQSNKIDLAKERWQSRIRNMPPKKREAMEKLATQRALTNIERDKKNLDKKLEREQRHAKLEEQQKKQRDTYLQSLTEDERASIDKRNAEQYQQLETQLMPQIEALKQP